jgi:hypothetical protein
VVAIGIRDEHAIYRLAVEQIQENQGADYSEESEAAPPRA